MSFEEIKSVLEINGKESQVFLPNEIFKDLRKNITNGSHVAYAYSYVYLAQFLYRNCKYFNTKILIDGNVMKEVLGYKKSNRTMNYLTTKGGKLDNIGYTESTKDFPVSWKFKLDDGEELSFIMASDMPKESLPSIAKSFFLKKPLKAFKRVIQRVDEEGQVIEEEIQGTFYDVSDTHSVDFDVFMYCMANEKIGTTGFYLYSWLKHKNDLHGGYDVSYEKLSAETGIARSTMVVHLNVLKAYNLIRFKFNQEYFVIGMTEGERMATTYYTNDYFYFNDEPQPFKKMKVISNSDYIQSKKNEVVVTMEQLPF